jgi:HEAT repeat protein
MNRKQRSYRGPAFLLAAMLAGAAAGDEPPQRASEALANFQTAWKPLAEGQYMRPLDDAGWKARVEALRALAGAGDGAVPVLTDALNKGDDETRVLAAQALALLPDPAAKASLAAALKDKHPAVRLYALDALSMFGKLPAEEPYQTLRQKDPNRDVRAHAAFALERDGKPQPAAIRQALRDYDSKKMATAKVGDKAPDFTLTGAAGEEVRLGDFRGKKPVVLVFVYGDT